MKLWPDVIANVFWSLGDGQLTYLQNDVWVRQAGQLRGF